MATLSATPCTAEDEPTYQEHISAPGCGVALPLAALKVASTCAVVASWHRSDGREPGSPVAAICAEDGATGVVDPLVDEAPEVDGADAEHATSPETEVTTIRICTSRRAVDIIFPI
jgi:hypothetical protein